MRKFNCLLVILVLTVWAAKLGSDPVPMESSPAKAAKTLECPPDMSEDALEDFRDEAIENLVSGNFAATRDKLRSCFPSGLPKCYSDLEYYARMKSTGTVTPNSDDYYVDPTSRLALKSEKDLPAEFIPPESQGVFRIPENIAEVAAKKGWKFLSYKTRSTGGFDRPPYLTIIAIPGKEKDIFIQISPRPGADALQNSDEPKPKLSPAEIATGQHTATIITTDKTVTPPVGQLRRAYLSDEDHKVYRWSNHLGSQDCIQCHSMPLRSISPRGYRVTNGSEKRMSAADEKMVDEINQMMMVDGLTWGDMKDLRDNPVRRGPAIDSQPLGWAPENSRTRKPEYIKNCAKQTSGISYKGISTMFSTSEDVYRFSQQPHDMDSIDAQKVATNMSCMQCHNGGIRGPLHENFSPGEIAFKVLVDRSMPPGANLTMDERFALVACLDAERQDLRSEWSKSGDWMRKMICQSMEKSSSAAKAPAKSSEPSTHKDSTAVH